MAAPFLGHDFLRQARVLHAVRHPMRVISSFVVGLGYFLDSVPGDPWQELIYAHLPELARPLHPLERAALYYARWNRMVEERARTSPFFCRVEDGPEPVLAHLGAACADAHLLSTHNVNTRMVGKPEVSYRELPRGRARRELEEAADRYGYDLSAPHGPHRPARSLWRLVRRALGKAGKVALTDKSGPG
jgi:hypothetical protein